MLGADLANLIRAIPLAPCRTQNILVRLQLRGLVVSRLFDGLSNASTDCARRMEPELPVRLVIACRITGVKSV